MKSKTRLAVITLLLTWSLAGFLVESLGQVIKAQAALDTSRMLIGDQVNLWLSLEQPAGLKIAFPSSKDTIAGHIEVLSVSPIDTVGNRRDGIWRLKQRLLLTSFDTGFFVIPSFIFRVGNGNDSITTRAMSLEVLGIPVDTTKGITDIKPPYEVPITFWEIAPYIFTGLLLAAFVVLYINYRRKKNLKPALLPEKVVPALPPHIWALEQLDELVREKLWQQGKIKLFYSRLTDILRQYIELRYKIPAMEQTTFEIHRAFSGSGMVAEPVLNSLKELLELADLVKFAKWSPVAEENEICQQSAYDFILRTKPVINLRKPVGDEENGTEKGE
jgi:hypothetical protein